MQSILFFLIYSHPISSQFVTLLVFFYFSKLHVYQENKSMLLEKIVQITRGKKVLEEAKKNLDKVRGERTYTSMYLTQKL